MERFFAELRRRNVLKTFLPYLGFVWLLLQVVDVLSPMLQLSPMVDTLIAVVLFAGIPVALYLSWYFDITSSGLKRVTANDAGDSAAFGVTQWTLFSLIIGLSGYGAWIYYDRLKDDFDKEQEGIVSELRAESIAVVPFRDSSPEQAQDYLATGLAEEIARLIGANSPLQVAASSSARSLAEQGLNPVDIARRLETDVVLTGSVRKQGNKLRVTAELIDAGTNKVVWSSSYNRSFQDVFSIESEIARSAANNLIDDFIAAEGVTNPLSPSSSDAYVLYLKGRQAYYRQTTDSMKEARVFFEQAITLDPEYSQAYVALADTVALMADGSRNFGVLKPRIAQMLATGHLEKALARSPELAEAHAVQGRVHDLGGEREQALAAFDTAVDLNPSLAKAHMWRYLVLRDLGREQEAFETLLQARDLDPESITLKFNYGFELRRRARFTEAIAVFERLVDEVPSSPMGYAGLAGTLFSLGDYSGSVAYWREAWSRSPENDDYLYSFLDILVMLGLNEEFARFSDDPAYAPNLLFNAGDSDGVVRYMENAIDAYPDDPWVTFEAAWYQMQLGNRARAAELLLRVESELEPPEMTDLPYCSPAIEVAWAYQVLEEAEKSASLMEACRSKLAGVENSGVRPHPQTYLQVRVASLAGSDEAAAALLELVNAGYRESWITRDPLLFRLEGTEAYRESIRRINENLAKERNEVRSDLAASPPAPAKSAD